MSSYSQETAPIGFVEAEGVRFAYRRFVKILVAPINALLLAEHLPNPQLIVYSDSSHGTHYQHASLFLKHANLFLTHSPEASVHNFSVWPF